MKISKFLAFSMMAATALTFGACSDDDDDDDVVTPPTDIKVEKIVLSSTNVEVEVGKTAVLTATLAPEGAKGTIEWSSSDINVATVDGGTVTGVKKGTAVITALCGDITANCAVTVSEKKEGDEIKTDYECLKGSDYYVFQIDEQTANTLGSKIKLDLRPDDQTKWLYIWENTYAAGTTTGKNFFNLAEGWVSLTVGSVGWSGFGLCYGTDGTADVDLSALNDIYKNPEEYTFHLAMKSTDNAAHQIIFYGAESSAAKFAIGGDFTDNGTTYPKKWDLTRDGEWNELEMSMKDVIDAGVIYPETWKVGITAKPENLVAFLSGGTAGVTLQYDAMFIYKKAKN